MDENSGNAKGWSLSQAAEYLCPDEWSAHRKASKAHSRGLRSSTVSVPEDKNRKAAMRDNKEFRHAVWEKLLPAIEEHGLGVVGIVSGDKDEISSITREQLHKISDPDFEDSEGRNRKTSLRISALRILPVLHSETAVQRLVGLTLKKAFKPHVLKDPEVKSLGRKAIAREPESKRLFLDGFRNLEHGECWPVRYEELDLAADAVAKSTISKDGPSAPVPPNEVVQAAAAMGNRYAALIDLLRNGLVRASGIPEGAAERSSVDEDVWDDDSVWIDFESNHLTRDGNAKDDRFWSYIKLHDPAIPDTKTQTTSTEPQRPKSGPVSKINQEIGFRIADFLIQEANKPDGLSETQEDLIEDVINYCKDKQSLKVGRTTVQKFLNEKLPGIMKNLRR